jgi:hypothetical protein
MQSQLESFVEKHISNTLYSSQLHALKSVMGSETVESSTPIKLHLSQSSLGEKKTKNLVQDMHFDQLAADSLASDFDDYYSSLSPFVLDDLDVSEAVIPTLPYIPKAYQPLKLQTKSSEVETSMTIRAGQPGAREVIATYVHGEARLQIKIALPSVYPLKRVVISCNKRMGITEETWKRWELQIVTLLSSRDGSIYRALSLWKSNIEKEFNGVEPCPICYSVIHIGNMALPKSTCPTCKHKFHSVCINTWFHSSKENLCPLCRQEFR